MFYVIFHFILCFFNVSINVYFIFVHVIGFHGDLFNVDKGDIIECQISHDTSSYAVIQEVADFVQPFSVCLILSSVHLAGGRRAF